MNSFYSIDLCCYLNIFSLSLQAQLYFLNISTCLNSGNNDKIKLVFSCNILNVRLVFSSQNRKLLISLSWYFYEGVWLEFSTSLNFNHKRCSSSLNNVTKYLTIITKIHCISLTHNTRHFRITNLHFQAIWGNIKTVTSDFNFITCIKKLALGIFKLTSPNSSASQVHH